MSTMKKEVFALSSDLNASLAVSAIEDATTDTLSEDGRPELPPLPGIYYDVPMLTYLGWDASSSSALGEMARSPAHARAFTEEPQTVGNEDTEARIVGIAAHMAVLEPESFARTYIRGPAGNWTNKGPKDEVAALRSANPGCVVLKPGKYDAVLRARDSIMTDEDAGPLLAAVTSVEVSIVWNDPGTGVRCKARPDALIPEWGTIADLKSAIDASRIGFAKAIASYGYHRKAAFYLDGMNVLDPWTGSDPSEWGDFAFIAFEKVNPFAVKVHQLGADSLELGRAQNAARLARWAECEEAGIWPAYPKGIEYIDVPDWAHYQED